SRPSRENSGFTDFVPTVHEELIKALGQLAGGIAHDFNNHLMIILGRLQMIRMKGAPPDLDRHAEKADRAALDAAKLVDRLKELSMHPGSVPLGPVQLNAVVETALSNARAWAKGHPKLSEATYSFALALHRPLLCTGIAADLQNALICLLKNAMEAMPEGGQIRISTRPAGHDVVVEIEDDGPGLDPDVRERIFEPFVTTRKGRSRGLGLCIVYGIVRRHGGNITITEGPTGGVRCTLTLEARPAHPANEESPSENPAMGAPD
ncbi:MAG: HAMP domain-containing sensor histidine kinase, partial [bacterium]